MKITSVSKLAFLSFMLVSACGQTSNLAEQHMQLLSTGKAGEAQSQYCSLEDNLRLTSVSSYELKSESEIDGGTEYIYSVNSPDLNGDVKIQVVNSDTFFDLAVVSTAKLNDLLESSAKLLGNEPELQPVPKREEYSQEDLCVFLPFEQFEAE